MEMDLKMDSVRGFFFEEHDVNLAISIIFW